MVRTARAACARCGHEHEVDVPVALHATGQPELRRRCLEGLLGLHACPACKRLVRTPIERAFYSDFDRGELIYVVGRTGRGLDEALDRVPELVEQHATRAPGLPEGWASSLTTRVVCGAQGLRDKLQVLDAGLDDRAVEAAKLALLEAWGLDPGEHLLYVAAAPEEGVLRLVLVRAGDAEAPWEALDERDVELDFGALRDLEQALARFPWLAGPWLVDAHFGRP